MNQTSTTMLLFLQIIGGTFYLLNKIFFSLKERSEGEAKRRYHILSWVAYLVGLPAILMIFAYKHNWIVFSIELGGSPAMIMGLIIAVRGRGKEPKWLDQVALVAVFLGLTASMWEFGGITSVTQILEIGLATGFLIGIYRLAKENLDGYLWFLLMNGSCAVLVFIQEYYIIFVQQFVSIGFVLDAYFIQRRRHADTY